MTYLAVLIILAARNTYFKRGRFARFFSGKASSRVYDRYCSVLTLTRQNDGSKWHERFNCLFPFHPQKNLRRRGRLCFVGTTGVGLVMLCFACKRSPVRARYSPPPNPLEAVCLPGDLSCQKNIA
jgi:hypothetical protein